MHSCFSADCNESVGNMVQAAVDSGLDEICFTDHMEAEDFHLGQWTFDPIERNCNITDAISCTQLRVKQGVEIGMTRNLELLKPLSDIVKAYPYDFVLLSMHTVDGTDPYSTDIYAGRNVQTLFRDYVENLFHLVHAFPSECYSVLSHIDYLTRGYGFGYFENGLARYGYASDEIDELFKYVVSEGKAIEINTSTWDRIPDRYEPGVDWLKRYAELGGEFVTIGSDAHEAGKVGAYFTRAAMIAAKAGIKYLAVYDQMKPGFHRIHG